MGTPSRARDAAGAAADTRTFVADRHGRIDAVVAAAFEDLSRSRVQRLIAAGLVDCDGATARKSETVEAGATITVRVPPAIEPGVYSGTIPVLWEDDELLAIDKPAGLAAHGSAGDSGAPSVASWLAARHPDVAALGGDRPGIVHRLDRETTGVMVLARTIRAAGVLRAAFAARDAAKVYVAICEGVAGRPQAVIEAEIGRDPRDRSRMAVVHQGREARTAYQVLATDGERSLLEVRPETGRTHQVRVHLAAIGLPVVGDSVYGNATERGRHLLHALSLEVPHPAGGRLALQAGLPADIAGAIDAMPAVGAAGEAGLNDGPWARLIEEVDA